MKRALLILCCVIAVGCDEDPARKVKVAERPAAPSTQVPANPPPAVAPTPAPKQRTTAIPLKKPATPPLSGWLADFCPIPAEESSGPSSFTVQGPCELQHTEAASCQAIGDDFLVAVTRKAKQGTLVAFINVEHYHGPGDYEGSQLFVAVQNGTTIHRWSSDAVSTVVGPGEAFIALPKTRLELEPTLRDCTTLIGPGSGYQYQCGGLDYSKSLVQKIDEFASGKLICSGKP